MAFIIVINSTFLFYIFLTFCILSKAAIFSYSDAQLSLCLGNPGYFNLKQGCSGGDPLL